MLNKTVAIPDAGIGANGSVACRQTRCGVGAPVPIPKHVSFDVLVWKWLQKVETGVAKSSTGSVDGRALDDGRTDRVRMRHCSRTMEGQNQWKRCEVAVGSDRPLRKIPRFERAGREAFGAVGARQVPTLKGPLPSVGGLKLLQVLSSGVGHIRMVRETPDDMGDDVGGVAGYM